MSSPEDSMPPPDAETGSLAQQQGRATDPSDKFWSMYVKQTTVIDRDLVEEWNETTNGILIFAGLFSAVITAFIIEGYKTLSPDTGELTVVLLTHISAQLANGTSAGPLPSTLSNFTPPKTSIWVNLLWFISLFLSLFCALSATLVQQWARKYKQSIERDPLPRKRGPVRVHLYWGLTKYKMAAVMDIVPGLLHISLFTFLAGLAGFITSIHEGVGSALIGLFTLGTILYFLTSAVPLRNTDCPFSTPLTSWLSFLFSLVPKKHDRRKGRSAQDDHSRGLEQDALERAHHYLVTSVTEERQFDELVDVLTDLYEGEVASSLIEEFHLYHGPRLLYHLEGLRDDPDQKAPNYLRFMYAAAHLDVSFQEKWIEICCDLFEHADLTIANLALGIAAQISRHSIKTPSRIKTGHSLIQADKILRTLRAFQLSSSQEPDEACEKPFSLIISCFAHVPSIVPPCLPQVYDILTKSEGKNGEEILAVRAATILLQEVTKVPRGKHAAFRQDFTDLILRLYELIQDPVALTAAISTLKACPSDKKIRAALARMASRKPCRVLSSAEHREEENPSQGDPDTMAPDAYVEPSSEGELLGTSVCSNAQDHEFQPAHTSSALFMVDHNDVQ